MMRQNLENNKQPNGSASQNSQPHTPKSGNYRPYDRPTSSTNSVQQKNETPKREKLLKSSVASEKREREKDHIKKPCNAFMWYMKENRANLLKAEGTQQKQSALLNQKLGQMWQALPKDEQDK